MPRTFTTLLFVIAGMAGTSVAQDAAAAPVEFFEKRIRPVLAERCYRCHNSTDAARGGLALDHRTGLLKGGRSGPALVPGDSQRSLLLRVIRHEIDGQRMPAEDGKLDAKTIDDFAVWIDGGAHDPRDAPPSADDLRSALRWETIRDRRARWWSWQPLAKADPARPAIDTYIDRKLAAAGLEAAPQADRFTLIRRATYILTGLPPTPDEINAFVADQRPDAYERLIDRLLASSAFGERWARHWMDWVRYADSHGSEGDPAIPNAWRYRDYLIRALNADVSLAQLVREHVAGDLIENPRIDEATGIVESRIGAAQFRFVQHGFAPTDALEEQVRFIDNQIDVVTKAFMGLTVSCARCHDHKFDAISQKDFHALYSTLVTARPASISIDTDARRDHELASLRRLKAEIRRQLVESWLRRLRNPALATGWGDQAGKDALDDPLHPLHYWNHGLPGTPEVSWETSRARWKASVRRRRSRETSPRALLDDWIHHGRGVAQGKTPAGEFHIEPDGDAILSGVLPSGIYSHLLSDKHRGVLMTPRLVFDMKAIWVRVRGDGGAKVRYVVHGYPRGGTVYPIHTVNGGRERWVKFDLSYWNGESGYIEATTSPDGAVEGDHGAQRSWFGITDIVFVSRDDEDRRETPRDEIADHLTPLLGNDPESPGSEGRIAHHLAALRRCVRAFATGAMSDDEARFLDAHVRYGLLPSTLAELPDLRSLVESYRVLERSIPVPRRVPGAVEEPSFDQPLFVRGDHGKKGDPVPPRFLESLDPAPYDTDTPARIQLAEDLVDDGNPFTARVLANRTWHHLFGRGIVATTDNLGHLGTPPTHPDLLDQLAHRLKDADWSLKSLIREIVMSRAFRRGTGYADARDPDNRWLARFSTRRLEAEAIRDGLLATSGRLDRTAAGPPVGGHSPRRSVYVRVKRNDLDPFLSVFDAPAPHTTHGRRAATNVPAQSLTLLNGTFAAAQARAWAERILKDRSLTSDEQRLDAMFLQGLGRRPTEAERRAFRSFAEGIHADRVALSAQLERLDDERRRLESSLRDLVEPVRHRLLAALDPSAAPKGPEPMAAWEFDDDAEDALGNLHGKLVGTARIADGALVLDGRGHVITGPIGRPLRAKTLEAWVQLDGLGQRAGGVMTVESPGGDTFDSIVFAERTPRRWLAGSDFFHRTRDLRGSDEQQAHRRSVHVAITYAEDGTVTAYRNGVPYGRSYRSNGPVAFEADAKVVFGLRHSPANPSKRLRGRIHRARLYDRALTADEIAATSRGGGPWVSTRRILDAMTPEQRTERLDLQRRIAENRSTRAAIELPEGFGARPVDVWTDVALSFFNLKEFIYIR